MPSKKVWIVEEIFKTGNPVWVFGCFFMDFFFKNRDDCCRSRKHQNTQEAVKNERFLRLIRQKTVQIVSIHCLCGGECWFYCGGENECWFHVEMKSCVCGSGILISLWRRNVDFCVRAVLMSISLPEMECWLHCGDIMFILLRVDLMLILLCGDAVLILLCGDMLISLWR